ncbi:MAG: hypothetical protein FWD06_05560 [Oscillospiraceae bacterium]|nr:hypothetical protein [Oscillospiraceae bacterium]
MKQLRALTWLQLTAAFLLALVPLEFSQQADFTGAPISSATPLRSVFFWLSMALVCAIVGFAIAMIFQLKHVRLTWPMFVLLGVFVARHLAGNLIFHQQPANMRAMTINMMVTTVLMLACVALAAVLSARHFKIVRAQGVGAAGSNTPRL